MTSVYIDVETTGLDPVTCSIFQIAGFIEKDGKKESFDLKMRPYHGEHMTQYAIEKTKMTDEIIYQYPDQQEAFNQFITMLNKYIDVNDWDDRAFFIGYNSSFDSDFVREWFKYNNYDKYAMYFWFPYIDVMALAAFALVGERKNLRNFQLTTVYNYVTGKVLTDAHNAFADIDATKELLNALTKRLTGIKPTPKIPVRKI